MDLEGTANIVNPLPASVILSDLQFVVMLHDDEGTWPYSPLPKDKPIRVGLAKMVPYDDHGSSQGDESIMIPSSSPPSSSSDSQVATTTTMIPPIISIGGSSLTRGTVQPIRLQLTTTNYEVCIRTFGAALRKNARLDLVNGTISLTVDNEGSHTYSTDFDAIDVDVPI
jgi:hypothetical protein